MPVFDFEGFIAEENTRQELVTEVERWISSIGSLNLKPENIFPRVHDSKHITQKKPGEMVTVAIRELFTIGQDKKPRTRNERRDICEALKNGFKQFVIKHEWTENEVRPKSLAIFISMRNRAEYEYDSCSIPLNEEGGMIKPPLDLLQCDSEKTSIFDGGDTVTIVRIVKLPTIKELPTIEEFAKCYDIAIEITDNLAYGPKYRFCAIFEDAEIQDTPSGLVGLSGHGATEKEAILAFAKKVSERTLVKHAFNKERQNKIIEIPKLKC